MNFLTPYRSNSMPSHAGDVPALSPSVLRRPRTDAQHIVLTGLDNSGSVFGSGAITELKLALPKYIADLQQDPAIRSSVLATFSVFADPDSWCVTSPFCPVMELVPPSLTSTGSSPVCTRLIESIKLLRARRQLVQSVLHVDQRHSWLIEMTDGFPSDSHRADEARRAIQEIAVAEGIEVYLFGLGEGADMRFLQSIAQEGRPAELLNSDRDFATLFAWLKKSLRIVSRSIMGTVTEFESLSGRIIRTE